MFSESTRTIKFPNSTTVLAVTEFKRPIGLSNIKIITMIFIIFALILFLKKESKKKA